MKYKTKFYFYHKKLIILADISTFQLLFNLSCDLHSLEIVSMNHQFLGSLNLHTIYQHTS